MYPNLLYQKVYHNMSTAEMARIIGVTSSALRRKMSNGYFTASECRTLCDYFGQSFEKLFATRDDVENTHS